MHPECGWHCPTSGDAGLDEKEKTRRALVLLPDCDALGLTALWSCHHTSPAERLPPQAVRQEKFFLL